jgi:hypothetical protein
MREASYRIPKQDIPEKAPQSTIELIDRRIANMSAWLKGTGQDCTTEQAHLDEGSPERAYWHHGYLVALKDIRKLLAQHSFN